MTKTELERAVRAILMEQLGAPQVLSLDLPRVQVDESDRLDTGNPNDRVWTHDLLTLSQSPPAGRGSDGHGEDHVPLASDLRRGGLYHRGTADGLQPVRFRHRRSRSGDLDPKAARFNFPRRNLPGSCMSPTLQIGTISRRNRDG